MSEAKDKILENAISRGELGRFLVGEEPYLVSSKGNVDDPQNAGWAFESQVMPYLRQQGHESFLQTLFAELETLLKEYPDKNRAIYSTVLWLLSYSYFRREKLVEKSANWADLPEVDFGTLQTVLKQVIESNKGNLLADTRWAGTPRTSTTGLWKPVVGCAERIRDQFGGPDFVPENK